MFSIQSHSFIDSPILQVMSVHSTRCPRPRCAWCLFPSCCFPRTLQSTPLWVSTLKTTTTTNNKKKLSVGQRIIVLLFILFFLFFFLVGRADIRVGTRALHVLNMCPAQRCLPNYSATSKRLYVFSTRKCNSGKSSCAERNSHSENSAKSIITMQNLE